MTEDGRGAGPNREGGATVAPRRNVRAITDRGQLCGVNDISFLRALETVIGIKGPYWKKASVRRVRKE